MLPYTSGYYLTVRSLILSVIHWFIQQTLIEDLLCASLVPSAVGVKRVKLDFCI